jgi:hypothetical protein
MKPCLAVLLALLAVACADGPSPRQKYGTMYGVTGTNVPLKADDPAPREVSIYSAGTLERAQGTGNGAGVGDPNAPR